METVIQTAVFKAIERLNEMRDADNYLATAPDTVIAGPAGQLDSMGLINLLLFTEEELSQVLKQPVDIMNTIGEQAASSAAFTLRELTELIRQSVDEVN